MNNRQRELLKHAADYLDRCLIAVADLSEAADDLELLGDLGRLRADLRIARERIRGVQDTHQT
jgi:hypothetical protein